MTRPRTFLLPEIPSGGELAARPRGGPTAPLPRAAAQAAAIAPGAPPR